MANTENGLFVWHELMVKDPKAAIAFYTEIVGWKTEPFGPEYTMWTGSQGPLGGVMTLPKEAEAMGAPSHWEGYVQVDDVDAVAASAQKLGATVYKTPEDIPTVGRFAVIGDPQGAVFSIFKPLKPMTLHQAEVPGEVCWNELLASDGEKALAFYSQLFGWKLLDRMDMGPAGSYLLYGIGERRIGGMMSIPPAGTPGAMPGMRPCWIFYFQTPDLEASLARAKSKGAKVLSGPMPVPGGGRIAQLLDPQGAVFAFHQNPPSEGKA